MNNELTEPLSNNQPEESERFHFEFFLVYYYLPPTHFFGGSNLER